MPRRTRETRPALAPTGPRPGSPEEQELFARHDIATKRLLTEAPASTAISGGRWTGGRGREYGDVTSTMPIAPTMPMPTLPEYPIMPELDESRMRYFTQRAARAPERALRRRTRKMIGKYDPNDPRYRYQMEGILGEFGSQLSNVYAQAGRAGRQEYMALEYAPRMQKWQMDIARIDREFQAKMTDYMARFGTRTGPGTGKGGDSLELSTSGGRPSYSRKLT